MAIALHHTIMGEVIPTEFPYVAIKFLANRGRMTSQTIDEPAKDPRLQLSKIEFIDESDGVFQVMDSSTVVGHLAWEGRHIVTDPPVALSDVSYSEYFGRVFDGSLTTKMYRTGHDFLDTRVFRPGFFYFEDISYSDVIGFGSNTAYGDTLASGGWDNESQQCKALLGTGHFEPFAAVVSLGEETFLDIEKFNRWRFYNANDNSRQPDRTWVWGEILGSADGKTWWLLDRFKDSAITNSNRELAYEGNLSVLGKGDLTGDLDLSERYM